MSYYELDYRRLSTEDWRDLKSTRWLAVALFAYGVAVVARKDTDVRLLRLS